MTRPERCSGCQGLLPEEAERCPSCGSSAALPLSPTLLSPQEADATDPEDAGVANTLLASPSDDPHATKLERHQRLDELLGAPLPKTERHDAVSATDGAHPEPVDALLGTVIAERFRVERRLGAGGMGTVYLAEQIAVGRKVVLKFLHASLSLQADLAERFAREALACSKLSAPNTIVLHDFGTADDGRLYMAMEYLEGHTLAELLADVGALPPLRAIAIALQVLSSLSEAHDKGIVHRDLKPENIMLVKRAGTVDYAKVLDFGIAKIVTDEGPEVAPMAAAELRHTRRRPPLRRHGEENEEGRLRGTRKSDANLTRQGEIFGSPRYMAPEQALGAAVSSETDIYALGVILYELLTGRPPFGGDNTLRLLHDHAHTTVRPLAEAFPHLGLPEELSRLVERCLEKEPTKRFPSAEALSEALRRTSQTVVERQEAEERALLELVGVKRRWPRGLRTAITVALGVCLGAPLGALLFGQREAKEGVALTPGDRLFVAASGPTPPWLEGTARRQPRRSAGRSVGQVHGATSQRDALRLAEAAAVARELDIPLRFDARREGKSHHEDLRLIAETYQRAKAPLPRRGDLWVKLLSVDRDGQRRYVYDGYVLLESAKGALQRTALRRLLALRRFDNASFLLDQAARRRHCDEAQRLAHRVREAITDMELPKSRKATMRRYLEQVQLRPCARGDSSEQGANSGEPVGGGRD